MQDEEENNCIEWVEGLAVLLACLIVGSITAINNYKKELQFRSLQAKQDDAHVTLWRNGEVVPVPVNEVCVGDVVQLDTGAKIPAGMTNLSLANHKFEFLINVAALPQMVS
jgi:Ca2+-transporting ATPase